MSTDATPRYAIIVGQGRSGTNWLLDLLDLSPYTLCRNEPYGCVGSPLRALFEHRGILRRDPGALDAGWDDAVRFTATHMGERDHRVRRPKHYIRPLTRHVGLYRMVQGPKYRRVLGALLPQLRGAEWRLPGWVCDSDALARARAVLKLNQAPGWAAHVLRHHPDTPVFHILRHPGGFLNSWANRYLAERDSAQVARENRERLHDAAREDPDFARLLPEVDDLSVEIAELWYWRYANETIAREGEGKPRYRALTFEGLAADPIGEMRTLYALAELPWNDEIEAAIRRECEQSLAISSAWRTKLTPDQVSLCETLLAESPLGALWDTADGSTR